VSVRTLILILSSVVLSALAQVLLKFGVSSASVRRSLDTGSPIERLLAFSLSPGVIAGLALYGVGALLWLNVLARTEVSQAYPFFGLGFVITAALGYLIFHDALGPARLAGTVLVIAGICLIARG
jgi:multidrug transporter EmrE-like cation transporter